MFLYILRLFIFCVYVCKYLSAHISPEVGSSCTAGFVTCLLAPALGKGDPPPACCRLPVAQLPGLLALGDVQFPKYGQCSAESLCTYTFVHMGSFPQGKFQDVKLVRQRVSGMGTWGVDDQADFRKA